MTIWTTDRILEARNRSALAESVTLPISQWREALDLMERAARMAPCEYPLTKPARLGQEFDAGSTEETDG